MEYQDFIDTLPSNNLMRFPDINLFLQIHSHCYPTEEEREQIYRLEAEISSYR
jgi:hypothetical protein